MVSIATATTFNVSNSTDLNNLAKQLISGDELILDGGNYRADIQLRELNNITIKSKQGDRAVFDGSRVIELSWEYHSNNIYKAKLTFPIWQLFIDDEQIVSSMFGEILQEKRFVEKLKPMGLLLKIVAT